MRISHFPRDIIEKMTEPQESCIIISITDPDLPEAKIVDHYNIWAIHRVQFHDVDREVSTSLGLFVLMTKHQARLMALFIESQIPRNPQRVLVHCEAGISRSAAVCAAIQKYIGQEEWAFQTGVPNMHVYRLLVEELLK